MLFAPISSLAWVGVVLFTLCGLSFLAGTSRKSWFDPSTAIGIWFLGTSFILHGVFVTGASTFGPIREMDVGADPYDGGVAYLYTNTWKEHATGGQLIRERMEIFGRYHLTENEANLYNSCIRYCLEREKRVFPLRIQVSTWDSRIHWMKFTNVSPPVTIGVPAESNPFSYLELFVGIMLVTLGFVTWKGAVQRGIRYGKHDPFAILAKG